MSIFWLLILVRPAVSHSASWRSDILLNPVVAMRSRSPSHTTREPLMPPWPSVMRTASAPARGSKRRSLRSRQVVAMREPTAFHAMLWTLSPWPLSVRVGASADPSMSQTLMRWSPDAEARTLAATGWKSTWPTLRPPAFSFPLGAKSSGCQPSSPQPLKTLSSTFQIKTGVRI